MEIDRLNENEKQTQTRLLKLICFGDSITNGGWPTILQSKLNYWDKYRCGIIAKGHNGDTTANAFDRLDSDVIQNMPGTVLIEFGVNDCNHRPWASVPRIGVQEFEKNLREFHRVIIKHGGSCIFIVNHLLMPIEGKYAHQGNGKSYLENLESYNDVIRKVADDLNCRVIDMPVQLREKSINLELFLNIDGVHLTNYGNQVYAEIICDEIKRIYG